MKPFCVIIPAVKKSVAFADDLVKKLDGVSLVQRAIDKGKGLAAAADIFVVTDSEEVCLISDRNGVRYSYRKDLQLNWSDLLDGLGFFLGTIQGSYRSVIIMPPYTPLVSVEDILGGYDRFVHEEADLLLTLRSSHHRVYRGEDNFLNNYFSDAPKEPGYVESRAFLIFRSETVGNGMGLRKVVPHVLDERAIEIESYRDWWICEKLLKRRRIVFRVIGYPEVGMGHIYRSLALAHEVTDHEIIFVCDEGSWIAVSKIAGSDYLIHVFPCDGIVEKIIALEPDLVINDILDTSNSYVEQLQRHGIKVMNFEDLGSGAPIADLTINELFDEPLLDGNSIRWGKGFYFLRDEFLGANPHRFKQRIDSLLLTFGGTDPSNITLKVLKALVSFCAEERIRIYVVAGEGYSYKAELVEYISTIHHAEIEFTCATGVISGIMEKCQLAIAANGRTVYELAHMNIPAIVISHHDREKTHQFSQEKNGFINLGLYQEGITNDHVIQSLKRLVHDNTHRKTLFKNISKHSFSGNKGKIVKMMLRLLEH